MVRVGIRAISVGLDQERKASLKSTEPGSHDRKSVVPFSKLRSNIPQMLKETLKEHENTSKRGYKTVS